MTDRKQPSDLTHDQLVAEALTGNPEPLRRSVARQLEDPTTDIDRTTSEPKGHAIDSDATAESTLRADLAVMARAAKIIEQAKTDEHARIEAERAAASESRSKTRAAIVWWQDRLFGAPLDRATPDSVMEGRAIREEQAANHVLGELRERPDEWWQQATPSQVCDAYLAAWLTADTPDRQAALAHIETQVDQRYGIDLHNLLTADDATRTDGDTATAADAPANCPSCHGTGMVTSAPWQDWFDHQDRRLARGDAEAEGVEEFDWPDTPEEVECDDCDGTGERPVDAVESMSLALRAALEGNQHTAAEHYEDARQAAGRGGVDPAVEADIYALLDRTPRDSHADDREASHADPSDSVPDRVYATEDGKLINAEGGPVWTYPEADLAAHREAERATMSGPGLERIYKTGDGRWFNAEGGPVVMLPEVDPVAEREGQRAAAARTADTATPASTTAHHPRPPLATSRVVRPWNKTWNPATTPSMGRWPGGDPRTDVSPSFSTRRPTPRPILPLTPAPTTTPARRPRRTQKAPGVSTTIRRRLSSLMRSRSATTTRPASTTCRPATPAAALRAGPRRRSTRLSWPSSS